MKTKTLGMTGALLLLGALWLLFLSNKLPRNRDSEHSNTEVNVGDLDKQMLAGTDLSCDPDIPCEYSDNVDLRIIVMVYNRAASLRKVLESLQKLELDGDIAALEIWIDRSKKNQKADLDTVTVAKDFKWNHGPSRVHIQKKHVGIYGQWIDTWRPRPDSSELALFLEDDVDVSPYIYRWLKAAYNKYHSLRNITGYALFEGAIYNLNTKKLPEDQLVFLHQRMGSQGMVPDPKHWKDFQDWYHSAFLDKQFHPYVHKDPDITSWYKAFEKQHKADSMWSIWYIYYNDKHNLLTLYSNLGKAINHKDPLFKANQYLAFHRKEQGLHFKGRPSSSADKLIVTWKNEFLDFPPAEKLVSFSYSGKPLK